MMIDQESQLMFISAMLGNPGLFARVQHLLQPAYFDSKYQDGVKFLKTFFAENRGVPSPEIFKTATKTQIPQVLSNMSQTDMNFLAQEIAKFCQIRAVTQAVLQSPKLIENGDLGKMLEIIKTAVQIQLHTDLGINYFDDPAARLTEEETEVIIKTGWADLDRLINGIQRQELILFLANSGGGKSVGMTNLAVNLLSQGLNGVYISLEMKDKLVARRLDSMISRISGFIIRDHKIEVCEQIERAKAAGYGDFHIKRMRESTTTSNDILSYCNEVQDRTGKKIDFVVGDYLDLMAPNSKVPDGNMFLKDKVVAEEYRAIGFDLDAIMISASQLGRSAIAATREERKIEQDHIQGGISKINTADLAIAMVKDEALDAANEYRFDVVKSRNSAGVGKSAHLGWDAISLRISNLVRKQQTAEKLDLKIPGVRKPGSSDDGLSMLG